MTAEAIARVVADLRAGRIRCPKDDLRPLAEPWPADPVVDATAIYRSLVDNPHPVYIYEDHPCIAPPWDHAAVSYVNEHGNVIVMLATVTDRGDATWEPAEPIDWGRVRWVLRTVIFAGGRGASGSMPTTGPMHGWAFAIYEDGTPADIQWTKILADYPEENWDMALLVLLGALNFMNCRNVELVEPRRPRPEARRVARTGVTVHTINVMPFGRSIRSALNRDGGGVPLTSVRGHFSCYGPDYNRGLLFGKYVGRFWIPQHARGAVDLGESIHDYELRP